MSELHQYIFDWNSLKKNAPLTNKPIEFADETLRDGVQSPSAKDPTIEEKIELIELMNKLGITTADIGLPGAGKRAFEDVSTLARHIIDNKLAIQMYCAARTVVPDIAPIVEISQKVGAPIAVYTFIGSSPIRQYVENWTVNSILKTSEDAISFAIKNNLEVCYVTEDTIRSTPQALDTLFRRVIHMGVKRLCLCDTVGYATPDGTKNLIEWTLGLIIGMGENVKIDWHGHNDRGLSVTNAIIAIEAGADRIHGTALGIGERVGNTQMDQLLMNLKLLKAIDNDLTHLVKYCRLAAKATGTEIPINYPLVGRDAFRTATGVHASAIIKALEKNDPDLADSVYSGVPAHLFGKEQEIDIGHMSGMSNVRYFLKKRNISYTEKLAKEILQVAKNSNRILSEEEVLSIVSRFS